MSTASEHPAWRDYRRRRAIFYGGLALWPAGIALLHATGAGVALLLGGYLVLVMHLLVAGPLLNTFACPACEHHWFGRRGLVYQGQLAMLLDLWTQRQCHHCGLAKFMSPAGWDKAELRE